MALSISYLILVNVVTVAININSSICGTFTPWIRLSLVAESFTSEIHVHGLNTPPSDPCYLSRAGLPRAVSGRGWRAAREMRRHREKKGEAGVGGVLGEGERNRKHPLRNEE